MGLYYVAYWNYGAETGVYYLRQKVFTTDLYQTKYFIKCNNTYEIVVLMSTLNFKSKSYFQPSEETIQ